MSEEKQRFKAMIGGKPYIIIGSRSEEHMKVVTETINEQLQQLSNLSKDLDAEKKAILMAINAVSDQLTMQQKMLEMEKKINELERGVEDSSQSNDESSNKG
ncbi:cell division protein ZapA [Atopococcus tabaci]|uniref:cell division protein ZapA n=1 Tax=Atopococcus tabaci TaxID=269774 RepID=UPI000427A154|nr:cell division protein ZapA [Atopococcus tabaci]